MHILSIRNLHVEFLNANELIEAVSGVNLDINEGEILALVGESGSGKTVTALSITKILPENAQIRQGEILFKGEDLLAYPEKKLQEIRGKEISYIFQQAQASLNPVIPVGHQITEAIIIHQDKSKKEAYKMALDLLGMVNLYPSEMIFRKYPHQLSGGMNQRIMIAIALAMRPKLLIADEPSTALDVTVEQEIIKLILALKKELRFSILFITHNLWLASKFADNIAIMYRGRVVEMTNTREIFTAPKHRHTIDLVNSIIHL